MHDEGPCSARVPPGRRVRRTDDLPLHRTREPAFGIADSWTDSSKKVRISGSCPPTSASDRCPGSPTGDVRAARPLAYRNTETGAQAVLHRAPDSYRYKVAWRNLVDNCPHVVAGYETKDAKSFRDELETASARTGVVPSVRTATWQSGGKRLTVRRFSAGSSAGTVGTKHPRESCTALSAD